MDDNTEERMELSDAPRQKFVEQAVENKCVDCGVSVWRTRKSPKVCCFDCRQRRKRENSHKYYQNRFKPFKAL